MGELFFRDRLRAAQVVGTTTFGSCTACCVRISPFSATSKPGPAFALEHATDGSQGHCLSLLPLSSFAHRTLPRTLPNLVFCRDSGQIHHCRVYDRAQAHWSGRRHSARRSESRGGRRAYSRAEVIEERRPRSGKQPRVDGRGSRPSRSQSSPHAQPQPRGALPRASLPRCRRR